MSKNLLSTSEAAKFLGISRIAVFKKVRQGRLPAVMIAGGYAMTRAALVLERKRMRRRDELRVLRRRGGRS